MSGGGDKVTVKVPTSGFRGGIVARLSIQAKLASGFGLLLALVAAVAAAGLLGLHSAQASFQSAIDRGLSIERLAEDMNRELMMARLAEKDFLLRLPADGFAAAFGRHVAENRSRVRHIRDIIAELEAGAQGGGAGDRRILEDLVTLKPYVDVYAEDFLAAVDTVAKTGHRSPLMEGRYREAALVVEPLAADIAESGKRQAMAETAMARSAIRRTVVILGVSVAAALALGLWLAYALGRRIRTPLRDLARVAEAVGAGNLSVQAEAASDDEIGTLARAFNAMTGRLRDLIASLEQRVAERKRAEEALRASQRLLQSVMDNSGAIIYVKDLEGRFILVNRRFEEIFGMDPIAIAGKTDGEVFPRELAETFRSGDRAALAAGRALESEDVLPHADGPHSYVSVKSPLRDVAGRAYAVCGVCTDVTERKQVEEQLRQSQKMEAIGRLAGGIAHDFNNLLTAINGYSAIALQSIDGTHPLYEFLREIHKSGERAAGLTRQLLAYSRKQPVEARILSLNTVVADIEGMLRRLIGENIRLATSLTPDLWLVKADRGQIEQVILNLVVNARDAMPEGGELMIATANEVLDAPPKGSPSDPQPGPSVVISVSDTGTGMTADVKARIFEPFFTTKGLGKGTGLGLSVVYGIVKHNEGGLMVASEPGQGTAFRIYFPKADAREVSQEEAQPAPGSYHGSETLLLVEDEESVRRFAGDALSAQGYKVLQAGNGRDALRLLKKRDSGVQLVITDVVMPDMGGKELAERIRGEHPLMPVLFVSGYTDGVIRPDAPDEGAFLLQKPFGPSDLARKVRDLLDGKDGRRAADALRK
jgi:PAS domain S-box-containing protein